MKVGAVICEYDPFHLGHQYLLSEMKKEGATLCLMSGGFTQRGLPALLSKYERARLAVLGGADLVLELPFPFSAARADIFASAGVSILDRLGNADALYFGSECGDIDRLADLSARTAEEEFQTQMQSALAAGQEVSFRHAYMKAAGEAFGSNDCLGAFYLSALRKSGSSIVPVTVKRLGAAFDGSGEGLASATAIRRALSENDLETVKNNVPAEAYSALAEVKTAGRLADTERLFALYAAKLRTEGECAFDGVPDMTQELCARLCRAALHARSFEELLALAGTKRYSPSRIRRCLLYMLLGVREGELTEPTYTTVLGANETGRALLSGIRKTARIHIITKPSDHKLRGDKTRRAFALSARADSVYELLCPCPRDGAAMLREKPFMV